MKRRLILLILTLGGLLMMAGGIARAQDGTAESEAVMATPAASPIHPVFPLLDGDRLNVLDSGGAVSAMTTCGGCHDTAFIAANNDHDGVGAAGFVGALSPWGRTAAIAAEVNCLLCHWPQPNHEASRAAAAEGSPADAVTATLAGSGIVDGAAGDWQYNAAAFDEAGNLRPDFVRVQDPTVANCGGCHGMTHNDPGTPLSFDALTEAEWATLTTGQVMSPQRISAGGLNVAGKTELGRSWDVHMERVLDCTDCHYSLNNPVYYREAGDEQPAHLEFDPRRIDLGEYLYRPVHRLAGVSAASDEGAAGEASMRRCESCHNLDAGHEWLPYADRHAASLACESCHVPTLYAPALAAIDWTVLDAAGEPLRAYRGLDGATLSTTTLITGYEPVLLPQTQPDGTTKLAPFNLISRWYWVYGNPTQPVPEDALHAAFFDGDEYVPDIVGAFDADGDGKLTAGELRITTEAQTSAVARRLAAAGLDNPRIAGEVQAYAIHHNVATDEWATRACRDCHGGDSRLAATFDLATGAPGGVTPALLTRGGVSWPGEISVAEDGALHFTPDTAEAGLYVLGHNAVALVDWLGMLMVLGVMAGVVVHGGLRFLAARRAARAGVVEEDGAREGEPVYMYDVYERLWHWLQTAAILLLLFTGLIIHKPDTFGIFSFAYVVQVHNILAVLLVVNAGLSLFYHLASGEIRQYVPRPRGFFDRAIVQMKYYLGGIFRRDEHPFEKTRQEKLNPLQQVTYVMVLNVLLPLQILTGALMWGAQRWPGVTEGMGGLPWLGPLHTLVAWSFTAFIILHVYLTTTGPTPAANIRAMIGGYEASAHDSPAVQTEEPAAGAAD